MRIEQVTCKNFLGLASFSAKLSEGLTLVAGPNGAGKSSLLESIRFAFGEKGRGVHLKADVKHLISQGAKDGFVAVTVDGQTYKRSLKTGEYAGSGPNGGIAEGALTYLLEAQRFAKQLPDERRKFLYTLLGVDTSHTAVGKLLEKSGVDLQIIAQVLPILRSGFEAAEKYADQQATESRGAWKAITGEAYGDKKAETWEPKPLLDIDDATRAKDADLVKQLPVHEEYRTELLKFIGVAEAREAAATNPDLATARESLPVWREKREQGKKRSDDLRAELQRLDARHILALNCPCCGEELALVGAELVKADQLPTTSVDEQRRQVREQVDQTNTAVQKIERNIALAERMIAGAEDTSSTGGSTLAELKAELAETDNAIGKARLARETLEIARRDAEKHRGDAENAAEHHAAVQSWKLCSDQLSPSGIQSVLLAQALDPFNERLAASSESCDWERVRLHPDMTITYGTIPYVLCSESEKWRADAMITDTLAKLSGLGIMLLDRLDVLDHAGRSNALFWLLGLAPTYNTIIVGATLKAAPVVEGCRVIWLDDATTGRKAA